MNILSDRYLLSHPVSPSIILTYRCQVEKERSSFSTCAPDGHLLRVTIPDAILIQFDLLRMSKIFFETCTC